MTVITHIRRPSRLADMVDKPGGISVGAALAQAEADLAHLQDQARAIIVDSLASLLAKPAPYMPEPVRIDLAYAASGRIIDAASPFAMDDLCAAAKGLCDLLDAATRIGSFDWRIVTVHAQAMQLLLTLSSDQAEARTAILANLHEVLRRKLPAAGQAG